ncbi:hypothetical protein [uncultured Desulfuromusa sp.]|uniref:hypothetical protein n=1 Tax=uncultured Desulfuromusa sp. TaxID=219183 RepID=UPI002AA741FA|nr:hypothetical protein [uncultured Desulfuromusa sp.]
MKIASIMIILIGLLFLAFGCTKEQVYRGVYEGLTTHEELKNTPGDSLSNHKSYDQYEIERKEMLQKE